MEYIKKEELIKGEIYHVQDGDFWMIGLVTKSNNGDNNWSLRGDATYITSKNKFEINTSWAYKSDTRTYRLATPEEKHWLNCCITANKFITFEEAMKTFIPEYVECTLQQICSDYKLGEIYKVSSTSQNVNKIESHNNQGMAFYQMNKHRFKPSTKEAYDAQFVVKEPEFVLPEKLCIKITKENLDFCKSLENNELKFHKNYPYSIGGYYSPIPNKDCNGFINIPKNYTEITFEQFKKYVLKEEIVEEKVIEPLPQFKVIETIETITKVENNEGNQFFIGDVVISDSGFVQTIKSFRYNVNKDNVLATTNVCNQISIARLEHYIEPKVEETLLEKAKIIEHSHDFKIGDKIKIKLGNREFDSVYKIIKIEDNVLFFGDSIHSRVLAKNVIKVN